MIKNLSFQNFCDEFCEIYKNNFSYEGKKALFFYLEEYEEETGTKVICDIISFCCGYSEYSSLEELQKNYTDISSMEELKEKTIVIPVLDWNDKETGRFIIQKF
jgi:hypothetical protein